MLSDLFPERRRGKILAWFYMAIPVGSALGFVIGGALAGTSLGWRGAFQIVVLPGLVLGAICFFMKDTGRRTDRPASPPWGKVLRELRGIRSFVLCCAGMTCSTFVLGGVAAWAPYYVFEREARFEISPASLQKIADLKASDGTAVVPPEVMEKLRLLVGPESLTTAELKSRLRDSTLTEDELKQYQSRIVEAVTAPNSVSLAHVNLVFGSMVVVSGLTATLFGGWLGDRLRSRFRGAYFKVCGYGAFIAFPAYLGMLFTPFPLAWVFLFVSTFFLFVNTGPANTILANVTSTRIRATAFAINILIIHALGDAISPPLIGLIADHSDLSTALLVVSVLVLGAGVLWSMGTKHLDEETRKVTEEDAAISSPTPP
jgi:MFS family permease